MYTDRPFQAEDAPFVVGLHRLEHAAPFVVAPMEDRVVEVAREPNVRMRVVLNSDGRRVGHWFAANHDGWLVEIHRIIAAEPRAGIGRWALREALRWAFDDIGAHRVWLEVTAANEGARRLYEHEGFVHEGTYRDGYRSDVDTYEDLVHYGLLRSERRASGG